ncbi:MAG: Cadherin proteinputative collagen-binding protein [Verrucomicrobiales bacterium]|nr:Cadherin proteinputative collagen-binding protein [Verrucomicrobiales bacterium]
MTDFHGFSKAAPGKAGAGWLCLHLTLFAAHANQVRMDAPPGSGFYGSDMAALPNGNIVVTDPEYDAPGPVSNVGAAYLYDGRTLELISVLTGTRAGDSVGVSITVLKNGNYLIGSPGWANGGKAKAAGALTWGSAVTGVSGRVSPDNSLVGTAAADRAGSGLIYPLSNGNAVACSPEAGNGDGIKTGAVTWINGGTGTTGPLSAANSLVGSTAYDSIGNYVTVLPTDDYVVITPLWDSGTAENAGAVTLGRGRTGVRGLISASNSLTGSAANDGVGSGGVTSLGNGNFLVSSPYWNNGAAAAAGAMTWCGGLTGTAGSVTPSNSLVGTRSNDRLGRPWATDTVGGITVLTNGNYLVLAPSWDNGPVTDAGAVVRGDGKTGITGTVSADNALVGGSQYDHVGTGACALANGNYVVISPGWSNGDEASAGAVTWCDGAAGKTGMVTAENSLVGLREDMVGGSGQIWEQSSGVAALSNGNYVVISPLWNGRRGRETFGAVTWGDGNAGVSGLVSTENSLVGSVGGDSVGSQGVAALANGNYVVCSPNWSGSPEYNRTLRGAVTWGSGITGVAGRVSHENSLVGRRRGDHVGWGRVTALSNGHYVVGSPEYQNQGIPESGAATWGNGFSGTAGEVSESNSLVGGHYRDEIGDTVRIKALKGVWRLLPALF